MLRQADKHLNLEWLLSSWQALPPERLWFRPIVGCLVHSLDPYQVPPFFVGHASPINRLMGAKTALLSKAVMRR
jgi:hypothetical protein